MGESPCEVQFEGQLIFDTRYNSNDIEARYDSKRRTVTVETRRNDVANVPGAYKIAVMPGGDIPVNEPNKTDIKAVIGPDARDHPLTEVNIVVLPKASKSAEVAFGSLTFDEGKAPQSVIISTDLIDGGVSNDLVGGKYYVFIESNMNVLPLSQDKHYRLTSHPRPAGTGGTYVDFELPAATLNDLTSKDVKLYVAAMDHVDADMQLTNPILLNISRSQPEPSPVIAKIIASGDAAPIASFDVTPPSDAVDGTFDLLGERYFTVSFDIDPATSTATEVSVRVPVPQKRDDYDVALMIWNRYRKVYDLIPAQYLNGFVSANVSIEYYFDEEKKADIYVVTFKRDGTTPPLPGGGSGGCAMGFGLAAVIGLAALATRKRSK